MDRLATIERIHSIQKHPNKDVEKLDVGRILEWPVVVAKDQFVNAQLVVFIRIDSILPESNPYFEFMRRQKFKVWSAKFKGAPSQGLVCPLAILPLGKSTMTDTGKGESIETQTQWEEGDDVTDLLKIIKYERPLDLSISGDAKGGFPTHLISITDEDNILNTPKILDEFRNAECYITLKADGSSMTVIHENDMIRVCSRRLEQKEGTGFWRFAEKYDIPNKLKSFGKNIALQAEACGGKIQGNPMGLADPDMFVFNVKEVSTGEFYGFVKIQEFCKSLNIPMVKLVCEPFIFDDSWTITKLQDLANKASYITSNGSIKIGEGIVLRPTTPKFSPILGKPLSVKIINQDYKQ